MIRAYYRPKDLTEALEILSRTDGEYRPLGGGVTLSQNQEQTVSVVDLQSLGLNSLTQEGQFLQIGATTTLQSLAVMENLQPGLRSAIQSETNFNLRHQATVAGALISASGRSTFGTALLALDAVLHWLPDSQDQMLGEWFALHQPPMNSRLITRIQIPLNASLAFDTIGRTPADLPIICAAVAKWPSGRTRITLGGFGSAPILALDAPEPGGAEAAVRDALSRAGDQWASAEYRQDAGARLILRLMGQDLTV
jgi:CO/xanthine dehydrogenase FAD-binding subunit